MSQITQHGNGPSWNKTSRYLDIETSNQDDATIKILIIAITCSALFLVVILSVIFLCWRQRSEKKNNEANIVER